PSATEAILGGPSGITSSSALAARSSGESRRLEAFGRRFTFADNEMSICRTSGCLVRPVSLDSLSLRSHLPGVTHFPADWAGTQVSFPRNWKDRGALVHVRLEEAKFQRVPKMPNDATVPRDVRTLFHSGSGIGASDGELLERFRTRRGEVAEAAFEMLVA